MSPSNPLDRRTVEGTSLTAEQRSQRARIAAHASWASRDRGETTRRAQAGLMARFERQVDPEGVLPAAERARRVESAKRAHFQQMAWKRHNKGANTSPLAPADAVEVQRQSHAARAREMRAGRRPTAPDAGASVVYFLVRGDRIKIGTSRNLVQRLKDLQQTMDDLAATLPGDERLERVWHLRFRHLRCRDSAGREWFKAAPELWDAIAEAASDI